ncbi:MAG: nitrate- and nitrite sensing domain-containing protein, partial [Thermodesulfobacteriota bacterium]
MRKETDQALLAFQQAMEKAAMDHKVKGTDKESRLRLLELRKKVETGGDMRELFQEYTQVVDSLLSLGRMVVESRTPPGMGKKMSSVLTLEALKESTGKLRGLGSGMIARDKALSMEELLELTALRGEIRSGLTSHSLVMRSTLLERVRRLGDSSSFVTAEQLLKSVLKKASQGGFSPHANELFRLHTDVISQMNDIVEEHLADLTNEVSEAEGLSMRQLWWAAGGLGILLGITFLGAGVLYRSVARTLFTTVGKLQRAADQNASSSSQLSSSSQSLAEGASEQAASL